VTVLAGVSCSSTSMINVGDASFETPWRGAHGPASAPRHTHSVRCLAYHAVRPPVPRSPAAAPLAAIAACVHTRSAHASAHPPMHRSSTLLRRSTLQLFEETVAITLVQKTRAVIGRTPSRRRSRRSSARCSGCSGCSGCTGRRRRREADAAGTRGLSSSRGAAFALASKCSSPPRCSTRPRRCRARLRRCPRAASHR